MSSSSGGSSWSWVGSYSYGTRPRGEALRVVEGFFESDMQDM